MPRVRRAYAGDGGYLHTLKNSSPRVRVMVRVRVR